MCLDSISDNVQLVQLALQSRPAGNGPGLGLHSKTNKLSRDGFSNRHMPSTRCFGYTGPSWCSLKKLMKFESTVGQTNSWTQRGHREEWGMSLDDQKDSGQVQIPRTQDRGGQTPEKSSYSVRSSWRRQLNFGLGRWPLGGSSICDSIEGWADLNWWG